MGWMYLLLAGFTEIGWAIGLKLSESWTRFWLSIITLMLIFVSYLFLSLALKTLPLGTAYAVWTGIGAVGTAFAGMLLFGESREVLRLICIGLIVTRIFGLKIFSPQ